jgi:hypothetical protein
MKRKSIGVIVFVGVFLPVLVALAMAAQDKYTVKVPNGLSFSEFRGYEAWQLVSISQNGDHIAAILGNPAMIEAYLAGVPGNGKPFPDGAKMAKIHWNPKKMEMFPTATVLVFCVRSSVSCKYPPTALTPMAVFIIGRG